MVFLVFLIWSKGSITFLYFINTLLRPSRVPPTTPKEQEAMLIVESPHPQQKSGILKTYAEMHPSLPENVRLQFLGGEKISNPRWSKEKEYSLPGESKAMLCMHLWSLMKENGCSDPQTIWEAIKKGWPECEHWGKEYCGHFWEVIYSGKESLKDDAERYQLETMLGAYKDMEKHFKDDKEHLLVNWPGAYGPTEENPNRSIESLWVNLLEELTHIPS